MDTCTSHDLTISQRDKQDAPYAAFVRSVGVGSQPYRTTEDGDETVPLAYVHDIPELTLDPFVIQNTDCFEDLIGFVYPDLLHADPADFKSRAILSSTNATIDTINEHILDVLPGDLLTAYSCDTVDPGAPNQKTFDFLSSSDLNSIDVTSVPPHSLHLKLNSMVMLTRNLNFKQGLVNGQKAVVRAFSPRVARVELLDDSSSLALIPRIRFKAKIGKNGITFSRLQLPLRVCYAVTINKSQGQTLSKIGLDLRNDVFTHGQLYVALSRAQKRESIMCLALPPRLLGTLNKCAFVSNMTSNPFINAATGSDANSLPLPPPYLHFIGCSAPEPTEPRLQLQQPEQAEPRHQRHPNHHEDGGWIEAKGGSR